jgi:HlyD family secretion protein
MARRSIFRKAALDRLSSPEQLDQLMEVTLPQGWLALIGAWVVVLVTLLWSVFGSIPTTVTGSGIIMSAAGIREVEVLRTGFVEELEVQEGDVVEAGDLIATIRQPQIDQQVAQARERVRLLQEERLIRQQFTDDNTELESQTLDEEDLDIERRILVAQQSITYLQGRWEAETEATSLGLITEQVVQNTLQELESARAEHSGLVLRLQNTDLRRLLLDNRAFETIEQIEERIRDAAATLALLELELEEASTILSPYPGTIREIRTDVGQLASAGQAIVSIEMNDSLHAVIFVPAEGKRIESGFSAQVSPVTVRREEFGFMRGTVSYVSSQPATPQGMRRQLNNDILVQRLSARGAPFVVHITLMTNEATPSNFQWSSRDGPDMSIESGTEIQVRVVVDRQRPISLVLPVLRNVLGLAA